jgi:hypothetical protein
MANLERRGRVLSMRIAPDEAPTAGELRPVDYALKSRSQLNLGVGNRAVAQLTTNDAAGKATRLAGIDKHPSGSLFLKLSEELR